MYQFTVIILSGAQLIINQSISNNFICRNWIDLIELLIAPDQAASKLNIPGAQTTDAATPINWFAVFV